MSSGDGIRGSGRGALGKRCTVGGDGGGGEERRSDLRE